MQRFGEKLRMLRTRRQMTTRDLALALGYTAHSNSYISLIENGKQKPSLNFVLRTVQFFNVSADRLTRDDLELEIDQEPNSGAEK